MLDEQVPGWHRVIDLNELRLSNCELCVCGQIGRAFDEKHLRGIRKPRRGSQFSGVLVFLKKKLATNASTFEIAERFGFDLATRKHSYEALDRAWRREIRRRLKADQKAAS